jgi:Mn2+/Fe2+ NRAMP family transporter
MRSHGSTLESDPVRRPGHESSRRAFRKAGRVTASGASFDSVASILPLATAYSVSEVFGQEAALDDPIHDAPVFYGTFAVVIAAASAIVLIPGAPLVPILYLSQALNAILLLPILVFVVGITRDRTLMGEHANGRVGTVLAVLAIVLLALCVGALAVLSVL